MDNVRHERITISDFANFLAFGPAWYGAECTRLPCILSSSIQGCPYLIELSGHHTLSQNCLSMEIRLF